MNKPSVSYGRMMSARRLAMMSTITLLIASFIGIGLADLDFASAQPLIIGCWLLPSLFLWARFLLMSLVCPWCGFGFFDSYANGFELLVRKKCAHCGMPENGGKDAER